MLDVMDSVDLYAITAAEERNVFAWLNSDVYDSLYDYLACNAAEESPMGSPFMVDIPAVSALDSGALPSPLANTMATAVMAENSATYGRTITTGVQLHSPCINNAGVNISHLAHEGFTSSSPHDLWPDRFEITSQETACLNTANIAAAAAATAAGWVAGSADPSAWSNTVVPAGSPQTHTVSSNTSPVLSYGSTEVQQAAAAAAAAASSKPKAPCRKRIRLAQQLKEQRKLQSETEVVSNDDNAKRRCVNGIFAQITAQAHQHMLLQQQQQQQQQQAVGVDYEQLLSQGQQLHNTLVLTSSQMVLQQQQQQQMLQQAHFVQYVQPQAHLFAQEQQQQLLLQEQQYMGSWPTVTMLQPVAQVTPRPDDDFDEWLENMLKQQPQQQQPQQQPPQQQPQQQQQQEEQQPQQQQPQVDAAAAAAAVRGFIGVRRTRPDCATFKAFIWCEGAGGKGGQVGCQHQHVALQHLAAGLGAVGRLACIKVYHCQLEWQPWLPGGPA